MSEPITLAEARRQLAELREIADAAHTWARAHRGHWPTQTMDEGDAAVRYVPRAEYLAAESALLALCTEGT